jgi:hypothetical protein
MIGFDTSRLDAEEGMSRDAHASIQHLGVVAPLAKGIDARTPDGRTPAHTSDPGP